MASRDQLLNSLMKHIYDNVKPSDYSLKFRGDLLKKNEKTPLWIVKGARRDMQDKNRIEINESKQSSLITQRLGNNSLELIPFFIRVVLLNEDDKDFFPDLSLIEAAILDHEYFWIYDDLNGKNSSQKKSKYRIAKVSTAKNQIESSADSNTDDVNTSEIRIYRVWVQNVRA